MGGGDHVEPDGVHASVGAVVDAGRCACVGEVVPWHAPGSGGAGFDVVDELCGDGGEQVVGVHQVSLRCRVGGFALGRLARRRKQPCQPEGLGPRNEGLDTAAGSEQHSRRPQAGATAHQLEPGDR